MRRRLGAATATLALAGLVACGAEPIDPIGTDAQFARIGDTGGRLFAVALTGAEEVPGPGDPDGSGHFSMVVNLGQGRICYQIHVQDIVLPAVGAHIHEAPAGDPGPVRVPLTAPDATGTSSGCVNVEAELLRDIRMNPDRYYVNVHSSDFPAGAVRGQLD